MRSLVLATAAIWAGHLRHGDPVLARRLEAGTVLSHPLVIGEVAMGRLRHREMILESLRALPAAVTASDNEVFDFIERERLYGQSLGYVDAHLLAAARLTPRARLWSRDARVREVAERMGTAFEAL
ncbi:MAG: VapC toxin family PIN domain ribonuclease [Caulobacteraceae bacterium]